MTLARNASGRFPLDFFSNLFGREIVEQQRNSVLRLLEAKLVAHNVDYADEFVTALRNLIAQPQRETILHVLKATAKML